MINLSKEVKALADMVIEMNNDENLIVDIITAITQEVEQLMTIENIRIITF